MDTATRTLFLPRLGRPALLALVLASAIPGAAFAELTVGGNLRLREDDFDPASFGAENQFGRAVAVCDFDGDGLEDLAIGSPNVDVFGLVEDAGAVHVAYGSDGGLTLAGHQTLTQPATGPDPPEEFDRFGWSLAGGDFDGDGYCDLAVGTPFEDFDGHDAAGAVHVFSGSRTGLERLSEVWTQDSPGVQSVAFSTEWFGHTLAAGDFDGDTFDDLAITALAETFDEGQVHVLFGTDDGLTGAGDDLIYQGDPLGTVGIREAGDSFGETLAVGRFNDDMYDDLAIGVPREDVGGGILDVGWVQVFYGSANGFFDRDQDLFDQSIIGQAAEHVDYFGEALAAGDFDGDGLDELAVGSPGENLWRAGVEVPDAGSVAVLNATAAGLSTAGAQLWTQDSPGVSDQVEEDDYFGNYLAAGDFDGDGRADLAVSAPGEDFEGGGIVDNGAVHVIYGSGAGLLGAREQFHGQGGWNVGAAEDDDRFAQSLATGDFDGDGVAALVAGVPREDLSGTTDAGLVGVVTGRRWTPSIFTDGFESGDLSAWTP